jgi:hypothetical protein
MTTSEDSSMTPTQVANFKKLRLVVFGSCMVVFSFILWRAMVPGGQISNMLHGPGLSKLSDTGRASVLAICVVVALIFGWFASTNIARVLARQVR